MRSVTKKALKDLVREYYNHLEIVRSEEPGPHSRRQFVYEGILGTLCRTFCSTPCVSPLNIQLTMEQLCNNEDTTGVSSRIKDLGRIISNVDTLSIKNMGILGRGICIMPVSIHCESVGHACMLVFDAYTSTQHFFNPWGTQDHWLSIAFADTTLVDGFTPAPVKEDAWPTWEMSLQGMWDSVLNRDNAGNCASYVIIVAMLCLRFGVGRPKLMADLLIISVQENGEIRGREITFIWNWVHQMCDYYMISDDMYNTPIIRRQARNLVIRLLFPPKRMQCGIYLFESDTLCMRQACPGDVLCWQHRYLIRNIDSTQPNKWDCGAPLEKCEQWWRRSPHAMVERQDESPPEHIIID